jgi:hypothetical protein
VPLFQRNHEIFYYDEYLVQVENNSHIRMRYLTIIILTLRVILIVRCMSAIEVILMVRLLIMYRFCMSIEFIL